MAGGIEILRLLATISVNKGEVTSDLKAVERQAETSAARLSQSAARIGAGVKAGLSSLSTLAAGLAVPITAAATALYMVGSRAADTAEELQKLQAQTGLTRQQIQELQFVTGQMEIDFGAVARASSFLQRSLLGVEEGTGNAAKVLAALGINVHDSEGKLRSMSEIFPQVIERLQSMENQTQRNMVASAVFGRGVAEITPLLAMNAEQMEELRTRAHDLGIVWSEDLYRAGLRLDARMDALNARWQGMKVTLLEKLVPAMEKLGPTFDKLADLAAKAAGAVARLVEAFSRLPEGTQQKLLGIAGAIAAIGSITTIAKLTGLSLVLRGVLGLLTKIPAIVTGVGAAFRWLAAGGGPIAILIAELAYLGKFAKWLYDQLTLIQRMKRGEAVKDPLRSPEERRQWRREHGLPDTPGMPMPKGPPAPGAFDLGSLGGGGKDAKAAAAAAEARRKELLEREQAWRELQAQIARDVTERTGEDIFRGRAGMPGETTAAIMAGYEQMWEELRAKGDEQQQAATEADREFWDRVEANAKEAAAERKQLDADWLAYRLDTGQVDLAAYLANLQTQLAATRDGTQEQLDLLKQIDDAKERMARAEQERIEAAATVAADYLDRLEESGNWQIMSLDQQAELLAQIVAYYGEQGIILQDVQRELDQINAKIAQMGLTWQNIWRGAVGKIGSAFEGLFDSLMQGTGNFRDFMQEVLAAIRQSIAKILADLVMSGLMKWVASALGFALGGPVGAAAGGAFVGDVVGGSVGAKGGLITRPTHLLAGEKGPELLVPMKELRPTFAEAAASGAIGGGLTLAPGAVQVNLGVESLDDLSLARLTRRLMPHLGAAMFRAWRLLPAGRG